jgi:hypothetical protein
MSLFRSAGFAFALVLTTFGCVGGGEDDGSENTSDKLNEGHSWRVLKVQYEVQQTGYWCGPAATRIALSTKVNPPSQGALANELGTTVNGTDYIGQVTSVLNAHLGGGAYATRSLPSDPPTPEQKSQFWRDIVADIDNNAPIVANIVAPPGNHPPGYPNETIYHYLTIIGYNPDTREVFIADPASFRGNQLYWLSFDQLATLVPPKGYAALTNASSGTRCDGGSGTTVGAIDTKYRALGGCASVLGVPVSDEQATPDRRGRYSVFARGSIYWTEATGAWEVHGVIRDRYKEVGWEAGVVGYPVSDEMKTADGVGRFNVFERGSIYWSEATGAHEVYGLIRDKYKEVGWEAGALGYPVSGEYAVPEGRRSDFEHGTITWNTTTNEVKVAIAGTK